MPTMRTDRGAVVSVRRAQRVPRQRTMRRSRVRLLGRARGMRESDLLVRGDDTGMFGLLCAGTRQRPGVGGGVQHVGRITLR
jgi:hypothetical protein